MQAWEGQCGRTSASRSVDLTLLIILFLKHPNILSFCNTLTRLCKPHSPTEAPAEEAEDVALDTVIKRRPACANDSHTDCISLAAAGVASMSSMCKYERHRTTPPEKKALEATEPRPLRTLGYGPGALDKAIHALPTDHGE